MAFLPGEISCYYYVICEKAEPKNNTNEKVQTIRRWHLKNAILPEEIKYGEIGFMRGPGNQWAGSLQLP